MGDVTEVCSQQVYLCRQKLGFSFYTIIVQVIDDHDMNYDKKLNISEYRGFMEEEVEEELLERSKDSNLTDQDQKDLQKLRDFLNSE